LIPNGPAAYERTGQELALIGGRPRVVRSSPEAAPSESNAPGKSGDDCGDAFFFENVTATETAAPFKVTFFGRPELV